MRVRDSSWDWRDERSDDRKYGVIKSLFGDAPPDYLWFDLGTELELDEKDFAHVAQRFFPIRPPSFGDIEVHESSTVPGSSVLRVRGAQNPYGLTTISLQNRDCRLMIVGHGGSGFNPERTRYFNFVDQWERATFRPGAFVRVKDEFRDRTIGAANGLSWNFLPCNTDCPEVWGMQVVQTEFEIASMRAFALMQAASASPAVAHFLLSQSSKRIEIPDETLELVHVNIIHPEDNPSLVRGRASIYAYMLRLEAEPDQG